MLRTFLLLAFVFLMLMLAGAACCPSVTEIPPSAETTIREDYLEWIHPPKLAGACEELPVVKVEWIDEALQPPLGVTSVTPRGAQGKRPVVWLKTGAKFAAILGLSDAQAEWIGGIVSAQPAMLLRDVSIYRLCRMSNVTPW